MGLPAKWNPAWNRADRHRMPALIHDELLDITGGWEGRKLLRYDALLLPEVWVAGLNGLLYRELLRRHHPVLPGAVVELVSDPAVRYGS